MQLPTLPRSPAVAVVMLGEGESVQLSTPAEKGRGVQFTRLVTHSPVPPVPFMPLVPPAARWTAVSRVYRGRTVVGVGGRCTVARS